MSYITDMSFLREYIARRPNTIALIALFCLAGFRLSVFAAATTLIPMDDAQSDHLKAYGVVFKTLKQGGTVYWLLNFRGGSFAVQNVADIELLCRMQGVKSNAVTNTEWATILTTIDNNNMEKVVLEKAPKIAIYTPPSKLPWDDAVTMALTYADIPYDKIYDKEVVSGSLTKYDWLHLHHEDFTGEYSRFFASFSSAPWYVRQKMDLEQIARGLGFSKVSDCKKAVSLSIRTFIENGGFLFAMCSAPGTLDIALSALGTDIADVPFDGDGVDPLYKQKLNFNNCMAFENFTIITDPMLPTYGNIDVNQVNTPARIPPGDIELFDFSAKLDPVPSMLVQNHVSTLKGFYGLFTSFNRSIIKKNITILADVPGTPEVRYIHGVRGKGQFAFLGGHDPEDYSHAIGDKPTLLDLHKHSPGYRLILNNVLFPAARKKEKKT